MVKEKNWMLIGNDDILEQLCREVVSENQEIVDQFKAGKTKVFKALLGKLAAKASKSADMAKCSKILQDLLKD